MSQIHLRLLGGVQASVCEDGTVRRLTLAPKPMALLAYLTVAGADGGPVRRDVLVALFWPELSAQHARAALRQMLFQLRRAVGERALVGDRETVAVDPGTVECDAVAFERLLERGQHAEAIDIYRGPFLDGFFVDGMSAEVETWVDAHRSRLARKAFLACGTLAEEARRSGNGLAAAQWARAAADLNPDDERAVRSLIGILAAFGDQAGALRVADEFARRLGREFDSAPSVETEALVASVRARRASSVVSVHTPPSIAPAQTIEAGKAEPVSPSEPPAASRVPDRVAASIGRGSVRRRASVAAMFVIAAGAGAFWVTHALAGEMRRATDSGAPPITIASAGAQQLYNAGIDRYRAGDNREGARLLGEALRQDSVCAMCAYYAGRADEGVDDAAAQRMLELAMRLSPRVSEPERLLIHFGWADAQNSVNRSAVAESLVTRYPAWAEAQQAAGEAAMTDGDYLTAATHFRRAIAEAQVEDSSSPPNSVASTAALQLVRAYEVADSLPAAVRVARALVARQPRSGIVWLLLSQVLSGSGRYEEGRAALDSSTRYATGTDDDPMHRAEIEIRAGNFATADDLLQALATTGNPDRRVDALWILTISLRTQGRLREALAVATGPLRRAESAFPASTGISVVAEAEARFELGEDARAAELFATAARFKDSLMRTAPAAVARQRAWMFTQAASALAAGGDTAALARLADTVRTWGQRSGLRRDNRLYLYLRGLSWVARARPDSALSWFEGATVSETDGFSRLNLARGRTLMALGRPRDAAAVLERSLAGPIDAGNSYVTRTDLQYEVARAYDMAGMADSASTYYGLVVRAWRDADPQFHRAVGYARARLGVHEQRAPAGQ